MASGLISVRRVAVLVVGLLLAGAALVAAGGQARAMAPPRLVLLAADPGPGTTVVVQGQGFPRRSVVQLRVAGTRVAVYRTSSAGRFTRRFVVPAGAGSASAVTTSGPGGAVLARSSLALAKDPAALVSTAPPRPGGYFSLKPVGSWRSLPNDSEAAAQVRRSTWEPRPQNTKANRTIPVGLALGKHGGVAPVWNSWLLPRVTGRFVGTTDEIVQWAAAKWGLPDDVLRAQMVTESYWYQGLTDAAGRPVPDKGFGDFSNNPSQCAPGYQVPCPTSFGVLQIKRASFHPGTYPHSRDSTAFNVDYVAAVLRGCFEGWETWLRGSAAAPTGYAAGDLNGCLGRWYAGAWRTATANRYATTVQRHRAARPWLAAGF